MPVSKEDLDVVAKTVWAESRGEGVTGMLCVAHVIKNRLEDKRWGDTYEKVCKAPYQFSCWLKSDPGYMRLVSWDWNSKEASKVLALGIASMVLHGFSKDPTNGANHYHTTMRPPWLPKAVWPPKWAASMGPATVVGSHSFYRDK